MRRGSVDNPETFVKRGRGRPCARTEAETLHVIAEAARAEFLTRGFSAAKVDDIAKRAGVSKKTLYRLAPAKADLFKASVTDRIARYLTLVEGEANEGLGVVATLERLMIAFGRLALSGETIAILKLAISEAERFPELSESFYQEAVLATQSALTKYLARQAANGSLRLDDPDEAAGMLRGMMIMERQRSVMLGHRELPSDDEIVARARACVRLFLKGCAGDAATGEV
jgi:AcrR family transcriptional regulator